MFNLLLAFLNFQNSNYVKANGFVVDFVFVQISVGGSFNHTNFGFCDCFFRVAVLKVFAVFDFNKNQSVFVFRNDVNFTVGVSVVAFDYLVPVFNQVINCYFLSVFPRLPF